MRKDLGGSHLIHIDEGTLKAREHSLRFEAPGWVWKGRLQKVLNGFLTIPRTPCSLSAPQLVFFPLSFKFSFPNLHLSQRGAFRVGGNHFCFFLSGSATSKGPQNRLQGQKLLLDDPAHGKGVNNHPATRWRTLPSISLPEQAEGSFLCDIHGIN